ncbi:heterokaryon incompatibility protein-domain-containing protein [Echria macrotheca]|uniref:Heterokaryon incompatibility protein-domain-containing protein n=1 Tax=Echria macrotheca TaxID=438768 RepID=A0AAJ0FD43_9PEZI|nr:heterokaryon incompatibility protein-domain-containing protein [Echria macrotheca]
MLCITCDNITLKSLNQPRGYAHLPSFHQLRVSSEDGRCSLCRILWTAVAAASAEEAKRKEEQGIDGNDDDAKFMDYPVRLVVDGLIAKNRQKALMKFRNDLYSHKELEHPSEYLYDLQTARKPATLLICSLQPATWEVGLELCERGVASLYQEPRGDVLAGRAYAGRPVSPRADSAACFRLIAHWMRTCITQHEHCRRAVCPYTRKEYPGDWARSPSYISSSASDLPSRRSQEPAYPELDPSTGGMATTTAWDLDRGSEEVTACPAPFLYLSESEDGDEAPEGRPRKRARISLPENKGQKAVEDQRASSPPRYDPDLAIKAANKKLLQDATVEQVELTSSRTGRSALSKGVLSDERIASKLSRNGDEDFYELHFRSDDIVKLRSDSRWSDHAARALKSAPSPPPLPTRYIHVDSNPPQLRTSQPDDRGFYIALSHCWGKSRPLVTTTATLAERMQGIPMHSLPQTFQDAVTITRELGLEYLWIDSLCIIQDSRSDWETESAKMGSTYSNAFLTISAGAATDSEQGIFRPRTIPPSPPVELRCNDADHEPVYIDHRSLDSPFETPQSTDTRAWCFQELALSPRVLVYGREMLGFLCDTTADVEHGGLDLKEDLAENENPPLLAPRLISHRARNPLGENGGETLSLIHYLHEDARSIATWPAVVNAFTKRDLTVEMDRLPALAGVVTELLSLTHRGDTYLAGLWRSSIFEDLLWEVDLAFTPQSTTWRRPKGYRAPSWSWASIEGPVRMDIKRDSGKWSGMYVAEDVKLVEAKVDPVSERNPYGEVKGGWLKLVTRLCKVVVGTYRNEESGINPEFWLKEDKWMDKRVMERTKELYVRDGDGGGKRRVGRVVLDMPGERDWDGTELWWLKLDCYLRGLVVIRAEGAGANAFSRDTLGEVAEIVLM